MENEPKQECIPEEVGDKVLRNENSVKEILIFYPGIHPTLGGYVQLHGWTGVETVVPKRVVTPVYKVNVTE